MRASDGSNGDDNYYIVSASSSSNLCPREENQSDNTHTGITGAVPVDDDELHYDIDRQMLLPSSMSYLPHPGLPTNIHYPILCVISCAVVGALLGVYANPTNESMISAILGHTCFVSHILKYVFQCSFNKLRMNTFGMSPDAVAWHMLSYISLTMFLLLNYFATDSNHITSDSLALDEIFYKGAYPLVYTLFSIVFIFVLTEQSSRLNTVDPKPLLITRISTSFIYAFIVIAGILSFVGLDFITTSQNTLIEFILLITSTFSQLLSYLLQATYNISLNKFIAQDLSYVYLDLLGHVCLLLFIPYTFAPRLLDDDTTSQTITFDSACIIFITQPIASSFAFFSITFNLIFILESFFLGDADPLNRGDETLFELCCLSAAQRFTLRRAPPNNTYAAVLPTSTPASTPSIPIRVQSLNIQSEEEKSNSSRSNSRATDNDNDDNNADDDDDNFISSSYRLAFQAVLDNLHLIEQSWIVVPHQGDNAYCNGTDTDTNEQILSPLLNDVDYSSESASMTYRSSNNDTNNGNSPNQSLMSRVRQVLGFNETGHTRQRNRNGNFYERL